MATLLKIGAGMAAVLLIVGFGAHEWTDYTFSQSPERIEAVRLETRDKVKRDEIQDRVSNLAGDGCQARAVELMALHSRKPVMARSDIPELLRDDMVLCVNRGILRAYVRDDLRDAGLMPFIVTNASTL